MRLKEKVAIITGVAAEQNLGKAMADAFAREGPKWAIADIHEMQTKQWEIFYNFAVTPWLVVGADLQIIKPSLANDTAVFPGLRTVLKF